MPPAPPPPTVMNALTVVDNLRMPAFSPASAHLSLRVPPIVRTRLAAAIKTQTQLIADNTEAHKTEVDEIREEFGEKIAALLTNMEEVKAELAAGLSEKVDANGKVRP